MLINFDYDGVLVDSFDPLLDLCSQAQEMAGKGRSPTAQDFQTMENLTFDELGRLIGLAGKEIKDFTRNIFELQQHHWQVALFPGIASTFAELAARHTLVIITSSQSEAVLETLRGFGLGSIIAEVRGGEQGTSKAERITAARADHGFSDNQTLMVGDAISDIREGKRAGVRTVAVSWGFQDRSLLARESPDFIADKPADLLRIAQEA